MTVRACQTGDGPHYWLLGIQGPEGTPGTCKLCKAKRSFNGGYVADRANAQASRTRGGATTKKRGRPVTLVGPVNSTHAIMPKGT